MHTTLRNHAASHAHHNARAAWLAAHAIKLVIAPRPLPAPAVVAPVADAAKFASAKDAIRFLLTHNPRLTLAELVRMSGKTEVNVRTMLSDLRTAKYCGKLGVFNTRTVREGGKVFYERVA